MKLIFECYLQNAMRAGAPVGIKVAASMVGFLEFGYLTIVFVLISANSV